MKSSIRLLLLGVFGLSIFNIAQAEITGLRVESTPEYVNVFWDALPADKLNGTDGYALQFSSFQTSVQLTKSANLYLSRGENSIALRRNSFDDNKYYYFRVYSYNRGDENALTKGNGSQLLKWRTDFQNNPTSEYITITDPVISGSSSDGGVDKDDFFDFGELRATSFDTFIDFNWSKPVLLAKTDFDGFLIRLSTNSDLSDPILEETLSRDDYKARIKGLNPNTQYYAGAYFYERSGGENVTFGNKNVKSLRTIAAIPRDGSTRASRGIEKLEKKLHGRNFTVGGSHTVTTPQATTATTAPLPASSISSSSDDTDIRSRIAALKRQISSLQNELRTLESRIGVTPSTTSSTRTTSTRASSTSGNSRLSKLKQLLQQRRSGR